jgi:carbamoyl-phosphate synthase large subunit
MGIDRDFGRAFAKAQAAAGGALPESGRIFLSVRDGDKAPRADRRRLTRLGFSLIATGGTAETLKRCGVDVDVVLKVHEGRPHIVDHLKNREVHLVINTVGDQASQRDSALIRRTALWPTFPTSPRWRGARGGGGDAGAPAGRIDVKTLQEYCRGRRAGDTRSGTA